jgi:hypothetical protein
LPHHNAGRCDLRDGLREHGQTQLSIRKANRERRDLRASLHQFPEFGDFQMGFGVQIEGANLRSGRRLRSGPVTAPS